MSSCRFTSVVRPAQYRSTRSDGSSAAQRRAVDQDVPGTDGEPGRAQLAGEADQQAGDRNARADQELRAPEVISSRLSRTTSRSSRSFTTAPSVSCALLDVQVRSRRGSPGCGPSRWSRPPPAAWPGPARGAGGRRRPPCGPAPRDAGLPDQDDLDLALGGRVADPVVQAAPLQRVVQLPGAVGGEDHERRALRLDRADLGDADLEVGEHLEQESLELVVGPVDLVDEQHRLVAGPDRLQQRPFQQELRAEELVHRFGVGRAGARTAPGCAASGGRSPTRTAPGWCRCPHSTAAGSACGRRPTR